MLKQEILDLKDELIRVSECLSTHEEVEELRIRYLGKKGKLTQILKGLGKIPAGERAQAGQLANEVKTYIQDALDKKKNQIQEEYYRDLGSKEWIDMTAQPQAFPHDALPTREKGHIHPVSLMQKKLEDIFISMGFSIFDGPQLEEDFYNFGALNFSEDHPARDMQDTFYSTKAKLLRTHTSSVQIRGLIAHPPPLRMIAPGRVFRHEEVDASHEHTFYQIEGMVVERHVNISHLLFLMKTLLKEVFSGEVEVRLRPGYFPFVEPGFELDMKCLICRGEGCSVCKRTGWVEILPCGLVHPNVIRACELDPDEWQGAAFGLGLNRLVMMHHGIEDIRYFQSSNLDFLKCF